MQVDRQELSEITRSLDKISDFLNGGKVYEALEDLKSFRNTMVSKYYKFKEESDKLPLFSRLNIKKNEILVLKSDDDFPVATLKSIENRISLLGINVLILGKGADILTILATEKDDTKK